MRIFLALFVALTLSQPVQAAPTPAEMRTHAYAGDFQALEDSLAQAHQLSLAGDMTFDDLRDLVIAITTTHPTFLATTDAWLVAYPNSPYANVARAFQYRTVGWNMRGSGVARGKSRDALAAFRDYQWAAAEHARTAYLAAPDYIPASDAVFRLQPATKMLPRLGYLAIVANVMQTTPNLGSLERAAGFAESGWGGNGLRDVTFLCETYAGMIPDHTYDEDICVIHLAYAARLRRQEMALAWERIGRRTHPTIEEAWAFRLTATPEDEQRPGDAAVVERYLTGSGRTDHNMAWRYALSFDVRAPAAQQLLSDVADAAVAEAREAITHDPFSPAILKILQRGAPLLNLNANDHLGEYNSDTKKTLWLRMAVASPFNAQSWLDVAWSFTNETDDILANRAMPYYANALFYSDHDIHVVEFALLHIIDVLGFDHFTRNPDATEVSVTQATPPEFACEFIRLDRIATHLCRQIGMGPERCPEIKQFRPFYDELVSQARATGQCQTEESASFADLKYDPVEVLLEDVLVPLEWE